MERVKGREQYPAPSGRWLNDYQKILDFASPSRISHSSTLSIDAKSLMHSPIRLWYREVDFSEVIRIRVLDVRIQAELRSQTARALETCICDFALIKSTTAEKRVSQD